MFPRRLGWENRLQNVISDYGYKAFLYGYSDCAMFAADVIKAICAVDVASMFRGKYASFDEVKRSMKADSLDEIIRATMQIYGFDEIDPKFAAPGDLLIVEIDGQQILGIKIGRSVTVRTFDGLDTVSINRAISAWSIG